MEFHDLGKNCSEVTCKQRDFLPFTCQSCGKVFCLDHRSQSAHQCNQADRGDKKVMICPICQKTIYYEMGKDSEEQVWAKHQARECGQINNHQRNSSPSKIVCASRGCNTKLTDVNKYECKKCRQQVCLKHRFEEDHDCPKTKQEIGTKKVIHQEKSEIKSKDVKDGNKQIKKKKRGFFGKLASKLACGSKKKNYDKGEIIH